MYMSHNPLQTNQNNNTSNQPSNSSVAAFANNNLGISQKTTTSFQHFKIVGEGAYGKVRKASDRETGEVVAIKTIYRSNGEDNEIRVLRRLNSFKEKENIIELKDVFYDQDFSVKPSYTSGLKEVPKRSLHLVFEYCESNLEAYKNMRLRPYHIKCIMRQILRGVLAAHLNSIIHRDLKSANILINNRGIVKIADWGLAEFYKKDTARSTNVVTLWYRAPELLLGDAYYTEAIDMWSVGCIFGELLLGEPILIGENENHQLELICQLCGSPTSESWSKHSTLPLAGKLTGRYPSNFEQRFKCIDPLARDLLSKMLTLDPVKRISVFDALDHDYFWSVDNFFISRNPGLLPKAEENHNIGSKKRERERSYHDQESHCSGAVSYRSSACSAATFAQPLQTSAFAPLLHPSKLYDANAPNAMPSPTAPIQSEVVMQFSIAANTPPRSVLTRQCSNDSGIESMNKRQKHHHAHSKENSIQATFAYPNQPNVYMNGN